MRIIQMLPTFAYGDAIGNDTLALQDTLRDAGYETEIYADVIDAKLGKDAAKQVEDYRYKEGDVIFYHLSTGSMCKYFFPHLFARHKE
jgi:L-malate glycosyltransferase